MAHLRGKLTKVSESHKRLRRSYKGIQRRYARVIKRHASAHKMLARLRLALSNGQALLADQDFEAVAHERALRLERARRRKARTAGRRGGVR